MPNQNQPDPNTKAPVADTSQQPVAAFPFPQADLPPLPPEFQNIPETNSPGEQPVQTTNAGSAAPPNDIKVSSIIPKPKKKFAGGRIIATILGLFVLIGGVGAGILLTQQKQLIPQKADTCSTDPSSGYYPCNCGSFYCGCVGTKCVNRCVDQSQLPNGCIGYINDHGTTPATAPPGGTCTNAGNPLVDGCVGRSPGYQYCSAGQEHECTEGTGNNICGSKIISSNCEDCVPDAHTGQLPPGCATNPPEPTPSPSPSPSPTPTESPNPTLSCTGLTKDVATPAYGDEVNFYCSTDMTGSPYAGFRWNFDGGNWAIFPGATYPVDPATHKAKLTLTIDHYAVYQVQCEICTDQSMTSCTPWAQAQ